ncbi:MAG: ABC transporter permease subunit [Candidatus Comchoanobacterales bacterium]
MIHYIVKRLLLLIPTLLGILTINFFLAQCLPGGPVDQAIAHMQGLSGSHNHTLNSSGSALNQTGDAQHQGISQEQIDRIKAMYGFDKPILVRYFTMLKQYLMFDFGESFNKHRSVVGLIGDCLPVSISLGLWSTLFIYLISIPLGIRKAYEQGSRFDTLTSILISACYAIPGFLISIGLLIIAMDVEWLAPGGVPEWFGKPTDLSLWGKILDYLKHFSLPVIAITLGGFAALTLLTKHSFQEEKNKPYVITARAKGLSEVMIKTKHVFRNAMLIVISGFPAAFVGIFFTGSILIEQCFNLHGLGLLGYEAAVTRDFPVMFGTLYIFTLIGLSINIICDLVYCWVDPRIDFESRS